jgi:hypothetical protein
MEEKKEELRVSNDAELSFFNRTFWDLWLQKLFRNFASVKYQLLMLLYVPIIYGMFSGKWVGAGAMIKWSAKIDPVVGLGFLGGGFATIALGRIYAKTKLTENGNGNNNHKELDTDK